MLKSHREEFRFESQRESEGRTTYKVVLYCLTNSTCVVEPLRAVEIMSKKK